MLFGWSVVSPGSRSALRLHTCMLQSWAVEKVVVRQTHLHHAIGIFRASLSISGEERTDYLSGGLEGTNDKYTHTLKNNKT